MALAKLFLKQNEEGCPDKEAAALPFAISSGTRMHAGFPVSRAPSGNVLPHGASYLG